MKIFFDTEFYERENKIDLISIGLVREDGVTYYAENRAFDWSTVPEGDWLHVNVRPKLRGVMWQHEPYWIAREVREFAWHNPEFWAYYADYDWVVLCKLFGRMVDLPVGWPKFCMDLKQLAVEKGNPRLPGKGAYMHNALDDALWCKAAHNWLTTVY